MSRVQLALNVSDLDRRSTSTRSCSPPSRPSAGPGYANFAIAEPPSSWCSSKGRRAGLAQPPGRRGRLRPTRWRRQHASDRRGPSRHRGRGYVLLRRAGQGLGRRARRRAVGDLHRAGRCRDAAGEPGTWTRPPTRCAAGPRLNQLPAAAEPMPPPGLARRATAEAVGTGFLVAAVVGSGIAAAAAVPERRRPPAARELVRHRRRPGRADPRLRAGVRAPTSTPSSRSPIGLLGGWPARPAPTSPPSSSGRWAARCWPTSCSSAPPSSGPPTTGPAGGLWLGEVVATFGLRAGDLCPRALNGPPGARSRWRLHQAAYWFTSSTSFANPAVTIARTLTDTFAGIEPASVPAFIAAQLLGATQPHRLGAPPVRHAATSTPPSATPTRSRTYPPWHVTDTPRRVPQQGQRRPPADGRRVARPPPTGSRSTPPARNQDRDSTLSPSRRWPRSASTSGQHPKVWTTDMLSQADVVITMAAATLAPTSPAPATRTGSSTTRPARTSPRSAASATTSGAAPRPLVADLRSRSAV